MKKKTKPLPAVESTKKPTKASSAAQHNKRGKEFANALNQAALRKQGR